LVVISLVNFGAGTYEFVTSGGTRYNTSCVSGTNLANTHLKWESNSSLNFGLDFSILRGKVSGSFDIYDRTTKDLLVSRSLPSLPDLFTSILTNLGEGGKQRI
jgi:hypothetical protein